MSDSPARSTLPLATVVHTRYRCLGTCRFPFALYSNAPAPDRTTCHFCHGVAGRVGAKTPLLKLLTQAPAKVAAVALGKAA